MAKERYYELHNETIVDLSKVVGVTKLQETDKCSFVFLKDMHIENGFVRAGKVFYFNLILSTQTNRSMVVNCVIPYHFPWSDSNTMFRDQYCLGMSPEDAEKLRLDFIAAWKEYNG